MARRKMTLRPSKARIALWAICAVVSVFLAVRLLEKAPDRLAGQEHMNAPDAIDRVGAAPRTGAPPAVRFGLMPRAAHLVVLSGLQMNQYDLAAADQGAVEVRIYDRSRGLSAALRKDEVDLACVPLRVAVELAASMGDAAPRVVAGAALGDERYVVRSGLAAFETLPLAPLRVGVLENPALDIAAALGVGSDDAATAHLVREASVARQLASREIDIAVLPQPLAAQAAAMSSSTVETGADVPGRRLHGGAVLVATRRLIDADPALLGRLVTSHVVSAAFAENDRETSIERAAAVLQSSGVDVVPALFWTRGVEGITFGPAIPRAELAELAGADDADAFVDESFLAEAIRTLEEDDGE